MANRETRRRKKIKNEVILETSDENVSNLIKMAVIVAVIFVAFYVITMLATGGFATDDNKSDTGSDTTEEATIQYDEILAGETFNMNYDEYYVMFYDFNASTANVYKTIVSNYITGHTDSKIYTVDLAKGFNTSYTGNTSNPSASSINDLKVNGPTLIQIKNGVPVSYSEGKEAIKNILK